MFHVGQMVVCVDDRPHGTSQHVPGKVPVEVGRVYTIAAFCDPPWSSSSYKCARKRGNATLREVDWPIGFCLHRFRPISKQSIQIFHDIANGVKQPEKENA